MKFTTIDISPELEKIVAGASKLYDKAPEAQKAAVSVQIRENMLVEIKRQGKIYIQEQTAVKTLVERDVKTSLMALKDASGAFSDLKKLKGKPKNARDIQALKNQIEACERLIAAKVATCQEAIDGLTAHLGWRSSSKKVPVDAEALRIVGKANLDSLQKDYEKIQGAGVALYGPVASVFLKAKEAHKAVTTIKNAADALASGLMTEEKSSSFAAPVLDELGGTSRNGLAVLLDAAMGEDSGAETSYNAVKGVLKDKKVSKSDLAAQLKMQNRVIDARRKKFDGMDAQVNTAKTQLYTVAKLASKAPLTAELNAQYKACAAKLKQIEKSLAAGKKKFAKQIQIVEKDMTKAAK